MTKILVCSECRVNEVKVDDDSEQTVCWVCIVRKLGWSEQIKRQLKEYEANLKEMGYI